MQMPKMVSDLVGKSFLFLVDGKALQRDALSNKFIVKNMSDDPVLIENVTSSYAVYEVII
jgi:hypothetical protein